MNYMITRCCIVAGMFVLFACGAQSSDLPSKVRSLNVPAFSKKYVYILVDEKEAGFANQANGFASSLKNRGYTVVRVNKDPVNTIANDLSARNLKSTDKVVFVLEGHGGHTGDSRGIFSTPANWAQHWVTLRDNSGNSVAFTAQELSGLVTTVRNADAAAAVVDASCSGGATVKHLEQLFPNDGKLCAIATTGAFTVSGTGFPNLGSAVGHSSMKNWDDLGVYTSQELLDAAKDNGRIHQWGYRSGCTQTMQMREGAATASSAATMWWHWNRMRDVHVLVHPERYFDKTPANVADPYYAPNPDYAVVNSYTTAYSQKWINDFTTARQDFFNQYTAGHTASFKQTSQMLIQTANQAMATLKELDDLFHQQKVGQKSLGEVLRELLRNSSCQVRGVPRVEIVRAIPDLSIIYRRHQLQGSVWDAYLESAVRTRSGHFSPVIRPMHMSPPVVEKKEMTRDISVVKRDPSLKYSVLLCQKGMGAVINEVLADYPVLQAPLEQYEGLVEQLVALRKATGQSLANSENRLCAQSIPCATLGL